MVGTVVLVSPLHQLDRRCAYYYETNEYSPRPMNSQLSPLKQYIHDLVRLVARIYDAELPVHQIYRDPKVITESSD
jgi:hypothetical protein